MENTVERKNKLILDVMAVNARPAWMHTDSGHTTSAGTTIHQANVRVIWLSKPRKKLTAYLGTVRLYQLSPFTTAAEALTACVQPIDRIIESRYDGEVFWHRGCGLDETEALLKQLYEDRVIPSDYVGFWAPGPIEPRGGFGHISTPDDPHISLCDSWLPFASSPDISATSGKTCPVCVSRHAALQNA